ncbi:MAG: hypothetical protein ACREKH_21620 [Candidatus Rokuibacteriota bacterium]
MVTEESAREDDHVQDVADVVREDAAVPSGVATLTRVADSVGDDRPDAPESMPASGSYSQRSQASSVPSPSPPLAGRHSANPDEIRPPAVENGPTAARLPSGRRCTAHTAPLSPEPSALHSAPFHRAM